jgi:hypothetical protein
MKNFQTEVPGTQIWFPYAAGPGATITSIAPTVPPAGEIRMDSGFVGLDIGDQAKITLDPPPRKCNSC